MADQRLDLLIFGATGITGFHCIPYIYKLSKENGRNLTWGISGRSEKKLKEVLDQEGKNLGVDLSQTPIVLADVKDSSSLYKMAQSTKVVINCCGPYRSLGEPVVKACIDAGTHHVDVSGEPEYIESLTANYHKAAQEKGVYIVSTCGMDCIPSDLGLTYLQEKFNGVLNSCVMHVEFGADVKDGGPVAGYGTWQSVVHALKHGTQISEFKKKFFPERSKFKPQLKVKYLPHRSEEDGWSLVFPGHDKVVVETTQKYLYENEFQRPVQVELFYNVKSFWNVVSTCSIMLFLILLAQFKCGRQLLLNYPEIWSFGLFSKDREPSKEVLENCWYQMTFHGEGWKEKLANIDDQYTIPPNKTIVARIKARDPAYMISCVGIVGAAIMILSENNQLPSKGGVYSPGAAFRKTSLMKLLIDHGMNFEVIHEKEL